MHTRGNVAFVAYKNKDADPGVFHLNREPGGSPFIGEINSNDIGSQQAAAENCPNADSDFAGKRA